MSSLPAWAVWIQLAESSEVDSTRAPSEFVRLVEEGDVASFEVSAPYGTVVTTTLRQRLNFGPLRYEWVDENRIRAEGAQLYSRFRFRKRRGLHRAVRITMAMAVLKC